MSKETREELKEVARKVISDAADQAGVPEVKILTQGKEARKTFAQWLATCYLARVLKKLFGR